MCVLLGMATTTVEMTRRVGGTKRKYSILRKVEGGLGLEEEEVEFLENIMPWCGFQLSLELDGEHNDGVSVTSFGLFFPHRQCYLWVGCCCCVTVRIWIRGQFGQSTINNAWLSAYESGSPGDVNKPEESFLALVPVEIWAFLQSSAVRTLGKKRLCFIHL